MKKRAETLKKFSILRPFPDPERRATGRGAIPPSLRPRGARARGAGTTRRSAPPSFPLRRASPRRRRRASAPSTWKAGSISSVPCSALRRASVFQAGHTQRSGSSPARGSLRVVQPHDGQAGLAWRSSTAASLRVGLDRRTGQTATRLSVGVGRPGTGQPGLTLRRNRPRTRPSAPEPPVWQSGEPGLGVRLGTPGHHAAGCPQSTSAHPREHPEGSLHGSPQALGTIPRTCRLTSRRRFPAPRHLPGGVLPSPAPSPRASAFQAPGTS